MEVDFIHSVIERKQKKRPNLSTISICVFKQRSQEKHFLTKLYNQTTRSSTISVLQMIKFDSVQPGHTVSDDCVVDLRELKYNLFIKKLQT